MGTINDSAGTQSHSLTAATRGKWYKTVTKPWKERVPWKEPTSEEPCLTPEDTAV